jgi:hypothetical protein
MDGLTTPADAILYLSLLYTAWTASFLCWRPIVGFPPMVLHHASASKYLTATVWVDPTHQPVSVHRQLMYGLDGLAGHLQLAGIFNQPRPTADLVRYYFGLFALYWVGTLQMALDLVG